jgi:hypothetical protein
VDKKELEKKVVSSLIEFAQRTTEDMPPIGDDMKPIPDLGMDSPDGIDWACELERLGIRIPPDINPLVVDDPKRRARTLREVLEICALYAEQPS